MTFLRLRLSERTQGLVLCAVALLVCLLPSSGSAVQATIMREMSVEELSVLAPHVVRGTVLGQVAQWSEDGKGILTYIDITIEERLKGGKPLPAVIQVVQPGGELDGVRMRIIGGPVFRDGEEIILFLDLYSDNPAESDMTILVGGAMGRMSVTRDPENPSKATVIRRFDDLEFARFVEDKGGRRMEIEAGPSPRAIPMGEFRRRVTKAAAAGILPGLREAGRGSDDLPKSRRKP